MAQTKLSQQIIEHVAGLIKLHLSDTEKGKIQSQLETALDPALTLEELKTDDVEITAQTTGLVNTLRDDEPGPSLPNSKAVQNAGKSKDGYIVVTRVL